MHGHKPRYLMAVVQLGMGLGVFARPHAAIGVFTFVQTRLGIPTEAYAMALIVSGLALALLARRVPRWALPALDWFTTVTFFFYAFSLVLYVVFEDVNFAPAFIYPATYLMFHWLSRGRGDESG